MAPKPPSSDDGKPAPADDPELAKKLALEAVPAGPATGGKAASASPDDDGDDGKDDELELDDDDDDEDLVVFTAKEAAGALTTIYGFVRPHLGNYRKLVAFVTFGVLVETLFNVIMPLSLKFLIDDALGEEDFQALYKILGVLAVAGIITSIIAVWYERWDARLAAGLIADTRTRLFEHVQNLPSSYFAKTKRGEILSRFSIDLAAYENSIKTFANSAALPFLELIAGIILMLFLNWQLAAIALLVFPITLIGPRILTPKAVQANYEQKLNEAALLGTVQENVAAQAVVKAFSLQRRTLGWFTMRNQEVRIKTASAVFLSTMVERTVTISVLLLHLVVLAIGAYLATKGQITIGTFVTFESAFWEVSYNIAHLMHFIPVSIQSAAAVRHMQELLDEPTRGADREHHQMQQQHRDRDRTLDHGRQEHRGGGLVAHQIVPHGEPAEGAALQAERLDHRLRRDVFLHRAEQRRLVELLLVIRLHCLRRQQPRADQRDRKHQQRHRGELPVQEQHQNDAGDQFEKRQCRAVGKCLDRIFEGRKVDGKPR